MMLPAKIGLVCGLGSSPATASASMGVGSEDELADAGSLVVPVAAGGGFSVPGAARFDGVLL